MKGVLVIFLIGASLFGCATQLRVAKPGEVFGGEYIQIHAPASGSWEIIRESSSGIAFGKGDRSIGESFIAWVAVFGLPPTSTSDEFEDFVRTAAKEDTDSERFALNQERLSSTGERSYPCVRYQSLALDKAPQAKVSPLLLELDALYCRHPVQPESGFAVIYSYRGKQRYPGLRVEAEKFIQGVQVPGK